MLKGMNIVKKEERKLTEAEEKRLQRFQKKADALADEGYEKTERTVGIVQANILALLVMLPFALIIAVPYVRKYGIPVIRSLSTYMLYLVLFFILMLVELVLHEGIHGLVWGLLNKEGFSAIEFGVIREYLTPYCYCGAPLLRWQYILGSVMPTIFLGFIQGWTAVVTGNLLIFALSMALMFGGGGDFLIIILLLLYRKRKRTLILMDHPTQLGSVLFEKD